MPNPFGGDYASFGDHNNAMLRRFLDTFGFDYEFASATDYYKAGRFDEALLRAAERYDEIMAVMLPTLGEERQATYSPFLPISPKTGRVLYVPMKKVDAKAGTITFDDEDDGDDAARHRRPREAAVEAGFRHALGGARRRFRDVRQGSPDQRVIYDRICNILGGRAPEHFVYELFLDENGQKISKSKGNGLTIDEWLTYAPTESLGALHVPEAAAGQEALLRCHPEGRRRILFLPRPPIPDRNGRSGWATPSGTSMTATRRRRHAGHVRAAAQPRQRVQRAEQERAVGLHLAPCAAA